MAAALKRNSHCSLDWPECNVVTSAAMIGAQMGELYVHGIYSYRCGLKSWDLTELDRASHNEVEKCSNETRGK
jgi:hypothetical protein